MKTNKISDISGKKKISLRYFLIICIISFSLGSCKKLTEVNAPATSLTGTSVYTNDGTAAAVLTGLYTNMSGSDMSGINTVSAQCGLSSDELTLYPGVTDVNLIALYKNALSNQVCPAFWQNFYNYLLTVNSAIEGLSGSTSLTPAVKQQLLGEAKFLRGFFYFYLTNLYGNVPLALSSNYQLNSKLGRTAQAQVYQQIINDLKDAQSLLNSAYVDATVVNPTTERLRPNKWAATALLARAYLYSGDYVNAEAQATAIIDNSGTYGLVSDLNSVFLENSSEAIWQLQPVNAGWNTEDARLFILPAGGPNYQNAVYLNTNLVNNFETGDLRKINWIDSVIVSSDVFYYPYKYKSATDGAPVTEYTMVLRLAEQYLIRAEARAQQGNIPGSQMDLNTIRARAGLPNTLANNKGSLLSAILHEKQVELFTEWGHRWLDLKRTKSVDSVMSKATLKKGGTWNTNWQLYPIPIYDTQTDPNLSQNPGY